MPECRGRHEPVCPDDDGSADGCKGILARLHGACDDELDKKGGMCVARETLPTGCEGIFVPGKECSSK